MLMNFSLLLISFCDINAILHGLTITQEKIRTFFGLYASQYRSEYVPMSQFKATKFFCISQKCSFSFEVAIRMFMHRKYLTV